MESQLTSGRGCSELYLLAGRSGVARFAAPSVIGELEGAVILVAEQRSGLMTPVASDDVGVPEIRVRSEDFRGHLFLIGNQIITAKYLPCRRSNDLSRQLILQSLHA